MWILRYPGISDEMHGISGSIISCSAVSLTPREIVPLVRLLGISELRFGGKQLMVGCGYAGIELLALWGQGDTAIGTDEECTAKRVLQIFDRARNVWFVVHQNCSGAREALMLGDEVE